MTAKKLLALLGLAAATTFSVPGCVLPRPGHKLALAVNAGIMVYGVATAPGVRSEDNGPSDSTFIVFAGITGIVLTLIGMKVLPPGVKDVPHQPPARCSSLSAIRCR